MPNKFITLFSAPDGKSYFKEEDPGVESEQPLGFYSKEYPVTGLRFRMFKEGANYDWHPAPRRQYIIYLKGKVLVEASGGEKRIFEPGDVLLANDLTGKGHITRTLTEGYSIIVTATDKTNDEEEAVSDRIRAKL